jgi:WD40 repeat protein
MRFRFLSAVVFLFAGTAGAATVHDPAPPIVVDIGHTAPIDFVAFAPGGAVLSAGQDGDLRWRDGQSAESRAVTILPPGNRMLAQAADGSFLTVDGSGVMHWWEAPKAGATAEVPPVLRRNFGTALNKNDRVRGAQFSPDGKTLAALVMLKKGASTTQDSYDDVLRLYNAADGKMRGEIALGPGTIANMPPLGFSGENVLVSTGGSPRVGRPTGQAFTVWSYNVNTGAQEREWKPPVDGGLTEEDLARIPARPLPPGIDPARVPQQQVDPFGAALQFSPDGRLLLTQTGVGLRLWNMDAETAVTLADSARLGGLFDVTFSPDSKAILITMGSGLWVWDSTGRLVGRTLVPGEIKSVAISPDSKTVAIGDTGARVFLYNAAALQTPRAVLPGFTQSWRAVRRAGEAIVAATDTAIATVARDGLQWQKIEGISSPAPVPATMKSTLQNLLLSPDGAVQVEAVYFDSYAANLEASGVPRGEVRARDVKSGKLLWRKADSGLFGVPVLTIDASGALWVSRSSGGRSVMGTRTDAWGGLQKWSLKGGDSQTFNIAWNSPHGPRPVYSAREILVADDVSRAVFADANGLRFVDLKQARQERILNSSVFREYVFALSPDGVWLVGGSRDGRVMLWNTQRDRKEYEIGADVTLKTFGDEWITSLAFAPDGKIAAALRDGRVLVWPAAPTKESLPLWDTPATRAAVHSLTFSRDGKTLWVGDARGALLARDAQSGELQNTLRLLPPAQPDASLSWVAWDKSGKITRPPT